jgi:hypothetical protein
VTTGDGSDWKTFFNQNWAGTCQQSWSSSSDTVNLQYPLRGTIRPKETPLNISAACQRSLGWTDRHRSTNRCRFFPISRLYRIVAKCDPICKEIMNTKSLPEWFSISCWRFGVKEPQISISITLVISLLNSAQGPFYNRGNCGPSICLTQYPEPWALRSDYQICSRARMRQQTKSE